MSRKCTFATLLVALVLSTQLGCGEGAPSNDDPTKLREFLNEQEETLDELDQMSNTD